MADISLGKLTKIKNIRSTWEREDRDFTQWLALEDNLSILADTIGVDLTLEGTEKNIGPFRADIVCQDSFENYVLIENQLEKTDHGHLGQLITYAAGLDVSSYENDETTIVWIADRFVDEHRSALEWLNKITSDEFRFFGLEIELWQIDNSKPALKFNVAVQPNNWEKMAVQAIQRNRQDISPLKLKQQKYWTSLSNYLENENSFLRSQKPGARQWFVFSVGRAGFHFHTTTHTAENRIGVELFISNDHAKAYFDLLYSQKEQIEKDLKLVLDWRRLPHKKGSRIIVFKESNFDNEDNWQTDMAWFKDTLENFDNVFRPIIRQLNIDEGDYEEEAA